MDRTYQNQDKKDDKGLFVGIEVENVKTKGQRTLFVSTPVFKTEEVVRAALDNNCEAVYFGANHVYHNFISPLMAFKISEFVRDYPELEVVVETTPEQLNVLESRMELDKIHLILSITVPNLKKFKNLYIKLDDRGFNATNAGVWTVPVRTITDLDGVFTSWAEYEGDTLV